MRLHKKFFLVSGISLWTLAVVFALLPVWPHVYYRISPRASETLASTIAYTVTEEPGTINQPSPTLTPAPTPTPITLPDFDPSLPEKDGLIIEKIGVRGEIHEGADWNTILKQGIWRVPNFGTPDRPGQPVILAAHRWGYLEWSAAFRKLNLSGNSENMSTLFTQPKQVLPSPTIKRTSFSTLANCGTHRFATSFMPIEQTSSFLLH